MKSITVEDLYLQSKVDEFEDYSLYVKLGDERVPLVLHCNLLVLLIDFGFFLIGS